MMKFGWFVSPFLLLGLISSISASGGKTRALEENDLNLVKSADDFLDAIEAASSDPESPSTVLVDANAIINFDNVAASGLDIGSKFFDAICEGYDDTNKCTLERTDASIGRFFFADDSGQLGVSFTGFEFIGGSTPEDEPQGGAFRIFCRDKNGYCTGSFTDCAFIDNTALEQGGAVYYITDYDAFISPPTTKASSLTFTRCKFESNTVSTRGRPYGGGAINADSNRSPVKLDIEQTVFSNNSAERGNDIWGTQSQNGQVVLACTETTTSGTDDDVEIHEFQGVPQTCSSTAAPSSAPSASAAPSNTPSASAAPSNTPSAPPSSAPSTLPSGIPSLSPSAPPSGTPSLSPSAPPSGIPSLSPSAPPSSAPSTLWQEITHDNFESGWGNFDRINDAQEDTYGALRVSSQNAFGLGQKDWIPNGSGALRIRGNSGNESSVFHREGHDVSGYSTLRVQFQFAARSMEKGEKFVLEYSSDGGSSWAPIKDYVQDDEGVNDEGTFYFPNDVTFSETAFWNATSHELDTSEAKIRFRCEASGKGDFIYIDEVMFEGLPL